VQGRGLLNDSGPRPESSQPLLVRAAPRHPPKSHGSLASRCCAPRFACRTVARARIGRHTGGKALAREQPSGEKAAIDPDGALPPLLDQSRTQTERRAATHRLLARLKSLGAAQGAETPRADAHRYVREQESLILGLLTGAVMARMGRWSSEVPCSR
jgi:hypothetical protein